IIVDAEGDRHADSHTIEEVLRQATDLADRAHGTRPTNRCRSAVWATFRRPLIPADAMGPSAAFFLPPVIYDPHGYGFMNVSVAIADVNGDGRPDLLVANRFACSSCANGSVAVLLGRGDGTFEGNGTAYDSGGRQAKSMAVADVNGDGKLDLLVANQCTRQGCTQFHGVVGVLLGNGDGTFQPVVDYSGGNHTSGVAIADVNGDGNLDVLETDMGWSGVGVLLGNGDGTFQQRVGYATG